MLDLFQHFPGIEDPETFQRQAGKFGMTCLANPGCLQRIPFELKAVYDILYATDLPYGARITFKKQKYQVTDPKKYAQRPGGGFL